jgi:putative ABC transport system substrate-binding protein
MAGAAQRDRAGHDASGGLRDVAIGSGTSQFAVIQAVAPSLRVEVNPVNLHDAGEIERAIATFAHVPNGGLIMTSSASAIRYRELVIALAARHKLPAVYWNASSWPPVA